MHSRDLREAGETPERLALVSVHREAPKLFTPRERAALAWAEAVTELGREGVSEAVYREALAELGESGLVDLTVAVCMINTWNRVSIAFTVEPGSYKAGEG